MESFSHLEDTVQGNMKTDMIYARLQVREPVANKAVPPFPNDTHSKAAFRISGRLSVLDDSINRLAFNTVHLCLRGVITSSIGRKNVLEDIITLTDVKTASEFRPTTPGNQSDTQSGRHVDFYFELPTSTATTEGILRPLPLSGTFKGTVNPNQNKALNDHHVVHGDCEVAYWIEANFRLAGKQVGFLNRHVQVSSLYPRLRASLTRCTPLVRRAKPDILARCRFQKTPDLLLTLSESDMTVERDCNTGKRHVRLPLALAMDTSDAFSLHSRQSLTCNVEAKWEVKTRFSTMAGHMCPARLKAGETINKTSTASMQKTTILFRPLPRYDEQEVQYVGRNSADPYVATSQIDLSVPDAVSQPSFDWKYLSRAYTLNLSLQFRGIQGAPNYSLYASIPLSVAAYGSKVDDAVLDHAAVDVLETTSESEGEDDILERLSSLEVGQARPPRHQQRAALRTPPPPYFR